MSSPPDWSGDIADQPRKSGYPKSFEKWGIDVVRAGYTLIPNHLININLYLSEKSKLTPTEMIVLFIIISNWWNPRKFPAASKKYIGERCGLSERQVQRILRRLEEKGAIRRYADPLNEVGGANKFDLRNILGLLERITGSYKNADHKQIIQLEFNFGDADKWPIGESYFERDDEVIPF